LLERARCKLVHRTADKGSPASAGKYIAQTCSYSGWSESSRQITGRNGNHLPIQGLDRKTMPTL